MICCRYQAICHPLSLNSRSGAGRAKRMILLVWVVRLDTLRNKKFTQKTKENKINTYIVLMIRLVWVVRKTPNKRVDICSLNSAFRTKEHLDVPFWFYPTQTWK